MSNDRSNTKDRAKTRAGAQPRSAERCGQDLRQIEIGIPDTHVPEFAEDVLRQCQLANANPHAKDDQDFIDSISWLNAGRAP